MSDSLSDWFEISSRTIDSIINFPVEQTLNWNPPQLLSDMWVISMWWTGVLVSATIGAMKDKEMPATLSSQLVMVPLRLFLGYSLIGFFWAVLTVPHAFAKFKTDDEDLNRYKHWIRVFVVTFLLAVGVFFILNEIV